MAELRTDYVDDVLDTSKNTIRKYKQIQNSDGTVSLVDVTEYLTVGTEFGAKDINDITKANNDLNKSLNGLSFAQDADGNWGYKIGGADTVYPFKSIDAVTTFINDISSSGQTKTVYTFQKDCTATIYAVGMAEGDQGDSHCLINPIIISVGSKSNGVWGGNVRINTARLENIKVSKGQSLTVYGVTYNNMYNVRYFISLFMI
jgi:hypothetical protein